MIQMPANLIGHVLTNCENKVWLSSQITLHIGILGRKPYKCQICTQGFGAPGTLTTHLRTHTGERPHVCKICGKQFPQAGYLTSHVRTHTGEKPIECQICGQRFNQSSRLTTHMR